MTGQLRRRKLLACGLVAGLAGIAGCLRQRPDASHWAAGIRWSDPPGEVFAERGFQTQAGSVFTGPASPSEYVRMNGGELQQLQHTSSEDDSAPASRGDHVELVYDFDGTLQGKETVFEYTIPDDEELIGLLAGFAECHRYRGSDEWVVRPLNVDLGTDLLRRQKETLIVEVERERRDEALDWYVWGHDESIRDALRERAAEDDRDVDVEFIEPGEEAMFGPASFHRVRMEVADGAERVARVSYPEPSADY